MVIRSFLEEIEEREKRQQPSVIDTVLAENKRITLLDSLTRILPTRSKTQKRRAPVSVLKNREALIRSSRTSAGDSIVGSRKPSLPAAVRTETTGNGNIAVSTLEDSSAPHSEKKTGALLTKKPDYVAVVQEELTAFGKQVAGYDDYTDLEQICKSGEILLNELESVKEHVDPVQYEKVETSMKAIVEKTKSYCRFLQDNYETDEERTAVIRISGVRKMYGDQLTYEQVQGAIRDLEKRLADGGERSKQLEGYRTILQDAAVYGLYSDEKSYDRAAEDLDRSLDKRFTGLWKIVKDIPDVRNYVDRKNTDEGESTVSEKKEKIAQNKETLLQQQEHEEFLRLLASGVDMTPKKETGLDEYGIPDQTYFLINRHLGDDADLTNAQFEFKYGGTSIATNEIALRITAAEKRYYNFLYKQRGKERADRYLDDVVYARINGEISEENKQAAKELAENHPILASLTSFLTKAASTVEALPMMLFDQEEYRRNYAHYERTLDYTNTVRQTRAAAYNEAFEGGDIVYNAMMGIGDMIGSIAIAKGIGAVTVGASQLNLVNNISRALMASQAGAQTMADARKRGLSDTQILGEGLTAMTAEFITEKIGMDKLFNQPAATFSQVLGMGFANVEEELIARAANTYADALIAGDKSQWNLQVKQYKQQGYSEEQAQRMALQDTLSTVSEEVATALLTGLLLGAGSAAYASLESSSVQYTIDSNDPKAARRLALQQVSENGHKALSPEAIRTAIENSQTSCEATLLSAVPEVLKNGVVLDRAGNQSAVGNTVLVNDVPHSVVVHTARGRNGSVRAIGVLLDGEVYFSLANGGERQYNKNKPVTDADLAAALLEDWGKTEDAAHANAATDTAATPVTDETLASALLEDWGLTDGDSGRVSERYCESVISGFSEDTLKGIASYHGENADAVVQYGIRNGKIDTKVHQGKQGKHSLYHPNYVPGKSYLLDNVDAQSLVDKYAGTGELKRSRNGDWSCKEVVVADHVIGYVISPVDGSVTPTKAFTIHYSHTGVHIVPKKEDF